MIEQDVWERLRILISKQIGFQIRPQDLVYFKPKAIARMEQLGLTQVTKYYEILQQISSPISSQRNIAQKEWQNLANFVTNGESFFFRDRGQFNLLSTKILPKIIQSKRLEKNKFSKPLYTLKIWSAGCSTGEEIYSLAMLISELIPDLEQWQISIIGTDINQDFLQKARQGIYKQWSFRQTDPSFKTKYFIKSKKQWQVKPYLKNMVNFYQDNLLEVDKISHCTYDFDLVICRNVFIYFSSSTIQKVIQKIEKTLKVRGFFLTGHAELQNISLTNFKTLTFNTSNIYQYQGIQVAEFGKDLKLTLDTHEHQIKPQNRVISKQNLNKERFISSPDKLSIKDKLKEIDILLDSNKYNQVIQQAEELLKNDNKNIKYHYLIAQSYFNQQNFSATKEYCELALKLDSLAIEPLVLLAKVATLEKNNRQAKELFKRVIYLEPNNLVAHLDLGSLYYLEGDQKRALKMYQNAESILASNPNTEISLVEKQQLRQRLNRLKKVLF